MQIESTIGWELRTGIVGCGRAIDKPLQRNSVLRMEFPKITGPSTRCGVGRCGHRPLRDDRGKIGFVLSLSF